MPYLLGTDEAGYGPNLGPLVVAATLWRIDERHAAECDLYDVLAEGVCDAAAASPERIAIADSKQLYQSGNGAAGIAALERGVLAFLQSAAKPFAGSDFLDLWRYCHQQNHFSTGGLPPWHDGFSCPVPAANEPAALQGDALRLQAVCERRGASCRAVRARGVFPREWNGLLERHENKATALSLITLRLATQLIEDLAAEAAGKQQTSTPAEPLVVMCDKHGGRNQYAALLQAALSELPGGNDVFVWRVGESREESRYRIDGLPMPVTVVFCAGGEKHLPVALASMTAKYLRELSMRAFNEFWRRHVPDLKPTAGYPVDAARFRAEIAHAQKELGMSDATLWRNK